MNPKLFTGKISLTVPSLLGTWKKSIPQACLLAGQAQYLRPLDVDGASDEQISVLGQSKPFSQQKPLIPSTDGQKLPPFRMQSNRHYKPELISKTLVCSLLVSVTSAGLIINRSSAMARSSKKYCDS